MNDKLAKEARRKALRLIELRKEPLEEGLHRWEDVWLEFYITPRQRRRAEAMALRKAAKK